MGVTRDFVAATIADALLPTFRRSIEDIIYEALDRRQIPTRTDFKELRDLVNTLRGQVNGAIQNLRGMAEQNEALEERIEESEQRNATGDHSNWASDLEELKRELKEIKEFDPRKIEADLLLLTQQLNTISEKFDQLSQPDSLMEKLAQMEAVQKEQQQKIAALQEQLASGKVENPMEVAEQTESLPDATTSETSELNWDQKLHYTKRVKLAVELAKTNPDQFKKIMEIETDLVKKRINDALNQ